MNLLKDNPIYQSDLQYIFEGLAPDERNKFNGASFLITGCAGFLGFYLMSFLTKFADQLKIKKIIGLDNFLLGTPAWIKELESKENVEIYNFDIVKFEQFNKAVICDVDYIIHMASIASPSFYRKFPIETIDANVWGLRSLLDYFKDKPIKGCLFFSSSEIYGDPVQEYIPTPESYRGNVAAIGPRACYDEAKRFGETICYLYAKTYQLPITIVRPFNNYGPGMKLDDKRVPADFAKSVCNKKDIIIYSDGTPTRTFCYVSDAIIGYLKALMYEQFDYFNIGIDKPEISISELAEIYIDAGKKVFGHQLAVHYRQSEEKTYLTDNPTRRCPDLTKAKKLLNFQPAIDVSQGVSRFLTFLKQEVSSK